MFAAYDSRSYDRMKDALCGCLCYPAVMTQSAAGNLIALPVADRLKLIQDLWDSIEAEASDPLPLPEWHRNEVDRRLDALDAGARIGAPWFEVRGRITGGR
jgi:putative addiction module component (TIGR02574 family)